MEAKITTSELKQIKSMFPECKIKRIRTYNFPAIHILVPDGDIESRICSSEYVIFRNYEGKIETEFGYHDHAWYGHNITDEAHTHSYFNEHGVKCTDIDYWDTLEEALNFIASEIYEN